MNELVQRTSSYKYDNTGENPQKTQRMIYHESEVPNPALSNDIRKGNNSLASTPNTNEEGIDQNGPGK